MNFDEKDMMINDGGANVHLPCHEIIFRLKMRTLPSPLQQDRSERKILPFSSQFNKIIINLSLDPRYIRLTVHHPQNSICIFILSSFL